MNYCRNLLLTFVVAISCFIPLLVQGTAPGNDGLPYITCLSQYPPASNEKPKKSFGTRVADFILGRKNAFELTRPVAVLSKDSLSFYVIDQENGVIFHVKDKVGEITHFKNKQYKIFPSLVGMTAYKENKILFTDTYYNKIFLFEPGKKSLTLLSDSSFDRPAGIAWLPAEKQIWVVETNAHRVSVLDENGNLVKRFGKRGLGPGEFNYPTSVCADKDGRVYIVDAMNFRVQIFSSEGVYISQFGKPGDGSGSFARPKGIAVDSYGNIYIADALFCAVQIFNREGQLLYTFGTKGQGKGEFWMPSGLFIDEKDRIFVADSYNSRVQVFQLMNGGK